jgi:hypothetical protein
MRYLRCSQQVFIRRRKVVQSYWWPHADEDDFSDVGVVEYVIKELFSRKLGDYYNSPMEEKQKRIFENRRETIMGYTKVYFS